MIRKIVLSCLLSPVLFLFFAVPARAANGSAGLGVSASGDQYAEVFLRIDRASSFQWELRAGGGPDETDALRLRLEGNFLVLLHPEGGFSPFARIGLGLVAVDNEVFPEFHLGCGAVYSINRYLLLCGDLTANYREGELDALVNLGVGLRFFD